MVDAGFACVTNGLNEGPTEMYIALKTPYNCIEDFKEMIGVDFSQGELWIGILTQSIDILLIINY